MTALTVDQRWLLAAVGGRQMADCLTSPRAGVAKLMVSMSGSTDAHRAGYPDWLTGGYSCGHGHIVSPFYANDSPRVRVGADELRRFAHTVPEQLRADLAAICRAQSRELQAFWALCRCSDPRLCVTPDAEHYSEPRYAQHVAAGRYYGAEIERLLLSALGLHEPVGQLDLFDQ